MAAHQGTTHDRAHQAAVKAHAALPGGKDLEGAREREPSAPDVEDHVEQARSDDDAEDHPDHDGEDVIDREPEPPAARRPVHHDASADEAEQVRDAVPANGERTQRKCHRVQHVIKVVQEHVLLAPY